VPRIFLTIPQSSSVLGLHHGEGEQRLHSGKLATSSMGKVTPVTLPIGLQNWNHRFAVNLSYKAYFIPYVTELAFFAQLSAFQRSRLEA